MSQEIIENATALAKGGRWQEAMVLLKPLVAENRKWPNAVAALAFCYEKAGDLNTAIYLYAQAIQIQSNHIWSDLLTRCRDKQRMRLEEIKRQRPRRVLIGWGAALLAVAALFASTLVLDAIGATLDSIASVNPQEYIAPLLVVTGLFGFFGLGLIAAWFVKRMEYFQKIVEAKGEAFIDSHHQPCWRCRLAYLKSLHECPYCAASRQAPVVPPRSAIYKEPVEAAPPHPELPGLPERTETNTAPTVASPKPPESRVIIEDQTAASPLPARLPYPPLYKRMNPRLALFVLLALVIVSASVAGGIYLLFGLQRPQAIRQALAMQKRGNYAAAYELVDKYLDERKQNVTEALAHSSGQKDAKQVLDRGLSEAFLLRGQLAMHLRVRPAYIVARSRSVDPPDTKTLATAWEEIDRFDYEEDFRQAIDLDWHARERVVNTLRRQIRLWLAASPGEDAVREFTRAATPAIEARDYARVHELWLGLAYIGPMEVSLKEAVSAFGPYDKLESLAWNKRYADWLKAENARVAKQGREAVLAIAQPLERVITAETNSKYKVNGQWAAELQPRSTAPADVKKGTPADCLELVSFAADRNPSPGYLTDLYVELVRAYALSATVPYRIYANQPNPVTFGRTNEASLQTASRYIVVALHDMETRLPRLVDAIPKNGFWANMMVLAGTDERWRYLTTQKAAEYFAAVYCGYAENCPDEHFWAYTQRVWPGLDPAAMARDLARQRPDLAHNDDFAFAVAVVQTMVEHRPSHLRHYVARFPKGRHVAKANEAIRLTAAGGQKTWFLDAANAASPVVHTSAYEGFRPAIP